MLIVAREFVVLPVKSETTVGGQCWGRERNGIQNEKKKLKNMK